jgi:hypothetical protein
MGMKMNAQTGTRCEFTEAEQLHILDAMQRYVNAAAEDYPDKAEVKKRLENLCFLFTHYRLQHAVRRGTKPEDMARLIGLTL